MDVECSMHQKYEKCIQTFGQKFLRDHLEGIGEDGRIILKCILNEMV
jgi:hypothetical protein